ncbi:MAG: RIP metalloprotease RseP [Proteobacteria bacterium]|nr:MAG: RIP metalloprotease RseP [Pseudomonadota bacterium]PIE18199.1 MAG: RIP metalloprotease RseP [Pseudomonadota bacterium]
MIVVYFILLVGVLIFVHELGHFLFAKLFDVKVLKFSLGFGPKATGFHRGETEYCVGWLPLGGFVKMLGEDPNDEIRREDQGRAFHQKPLWQRYIVVFAGPAFNLIFPIFIYVVFFAAHTTLLPAVIGKSFRGQPAAEAGLLPGDTIVEINGKKVRYWEDLKRQISGHPSESLKFRIERDGKTFERFITPREHVRQHPLGYKERYGLVGISPYFELAQIGISDPRSPAARARLQTGDLITSVNGHPVERWADLAKRLRRNRGQALNVSYLRPGGTVSGFFDLHLLAPAVAVVDPTPTIVAGSIKGYQTGIHSAEFFVQHVERDSPAWTIGMRSGDRVVAFNGKPVTHWELIELELRSRRSQKGGGHTIRWIPFGGTETSGKFKLARKTFTDEYKQEQVRYVFGAHNRLLTKSADPIPIEGRIGYAISESVRKTGEIVGVMTVAFVQLFRGAISSDTIGGPVMLAYTAHVAAKKGWDHFLWMMAVISINLGIINLLPIPILDGGHIMFFTFEAIKRRPLSLRAREIASYIGLFLLISLMVFALKNDLVRYLFTK